ncbi:unnamed protein product [Microthlaspi erraticum]|nr:unnamed protein product [Microthlaspi erraticum]
MWAFSDKELDTKLRTILISEAGKTLLDLDPTLFPVEKLLQLLDKHFYFLLTVEQSPPSSIKNALSPLMKALSAETLLKHSNVDVKLFTASCITEVLRINGPVAPYDDDKMKEVFQLIVSSFEHLDDKSSLSYTKRTSILNTMAKSQVCVLMLDLGYDALLIEMFQHFLKGLR